MPLFAPRPGEAAVNGHVPPDKLQFFIPDFAVDRRQHPVGGGHPLGGREGDDGAAHAFVVDLMKVKAFVEIQKPFRLEAEGEAPYFRGQLAARGLGLAGPGIVAVEVAKIGIEVRDEPFVGDEPGHIRARNDDEPALGQGPLADDFSGHRPGGFITVDSAADENRRAWNARVPEIPFRGEAGAGQELVRG